MAEQESYRGAYHNIRTHNHDGPFTFKHAANFKPMSSQESHELDFLPESFTNYIKHESHMFGHHLEIATENKHKDQWDVTAYSEISDELDTIDFGKVGIYVREYPTKHSIDIGNDHPKKRIKRYDFFGNRDSGHEKFICIDGCRRCDGAQPLICMRDSKAKPRMVMFCPTDNLISAWHIWKEDTILHNLTHSRNKMEQYIVDRQDGDLVDVCRANDFALLVLVTKPGGGQKIAKFNLPHKHKRGGSNKLKFKELHTVRPLPHKEVIAKMTYVSSKDILITCLRDIEDPQHPSHHERHHFHHEHKSGIVGQHLLDSQGPSILWWFDEYENHPVKCMSFSPHYRMDNDNGHYVFVPMNDYLVIFESETGEIKDSFPLPGRSRGIIFSVTYVRDLMDDRFPNQAGLVLKHGPSPTEENPSHWITTLRMKRRKVAH